MIDSAAVQQDTVTVASSDAKAVGCASGSLDCRVVVRQSKQLGSLGSCDRLRCYVLGCGDDDGLRIGLCKGRLGYCVDSRNSDSIGWIVGYRVAARKGSWLILLVCMIFEDNPVDRQQKGDGRGDR